MSQYKWSVEESKLRLMCQWMSCKYINIEMTLGELMNHVNQHIDFCRQIYNRPAAEDDDDQAQDGGKDCSEKNGGCVLFHCPWYHSECSVVLSDIDMLSGHCQNHVHHDKLRAIGTYIQHRERPGVPCDVTPQWTVAWPPYHCKWDTCDAQTYVGFKFYEHVNLHVMEADSDFVCRWEDCCHRFRVRAKLRAHMRTHTKQPTVVCPMCHQAFSKNSSYVEHLQRIEVKPESAVTATQKNKIYKCKNCNKHFNFERLCKTHMLQCSINSTGCACLICDKVLSTTSALKLHIMYKHNTNMTYHCKHCQKYRCKTQFDLSRHERACQMRCSGDGFICGLEACEFVAPTQKLLLQHKRKEHAEKMMADARKYECHLCSKIYVRGDSLTSHLRNVHEISALDMKFRRYKKCTDGFYRILAYQENDL